MKTLPIEPTPALRAALARPGTAAAFAAIARDGATAEVTLDLVDMTPARLMVLADRLLHRADEKLADQPANTDRHAAAVRIRAARSALAVFPPANGGG